MSILWFSGFEAQSVTAGVEWETLSGTPTINTSIRHGDGNHGLASLRVNPSAAVWNLRHQLKGTAISSETWWGRVYIYVVTAPGSTLPIFEFTNSTVGVLQIRMASDRTLEFWAGPTLAKQGSSSRVLQPNQWFCIEMKGVVSSGGIMTDGEARINGEVFASFTGGSFNPPQSVRVGMSSTGTCDIYFDDLEVRDTAAGPTGYPGPGFVAMLMASGTGASAQWRNAVGGQANNYQEVDEFPWDDATSYVDTNAVSANATDSYALADMPSGCDANATINCVAIGVRFARSSNSTSDIFNVQWTSGGNTDSGTNIQPNSTTWATNATAAPRLYTLTSYDMPGTSTNAISEADINSAEIGIKATTVSNSNDARVSALWMMVSYCPSTYVESIWAASVATAQSSAGVTSLATASITPIANHLYLGWAVSRTAANDPNHATASGGGLTWVEVQSINFDNAGSQKRLTLLRALSQSPSAGAITFDFNGQTQSDIVVGVIDVTGVVISGANGADAIVQNATNQDVSGTATTLTATLSAFAATDNATLGILGIGNTGTLTPGTGFAVTGSNNTTVNLTGAAEFKEANDTTVDMTFSVGAELGIIAVELRSLALPIYPDKWNVPFQIPQFRLKEERYGFPYFMPDVKPPTTVVETITPDKWQPDTEIPASEKTKVSSY